MKNILIKIIIGISFLIMTIFSMEMLHADEMDETLKKLEISGFLRMRHWHIGSETYVPGKFPNDDDYNNVYYDDLFLRTNFELKLLSSVHIKTVFDVISNFGKDTFSLGNGGTNLVTRDVYAIIKTSRKGQLEIGLRPFSFPGGYILARDGTGAEYSHVVWKGKIKLYAGLLKAYDDASDSFGKDSEEADYTDDDIYYSRLEINFIPEMSSEVYYIHEYDKFTTEGTEDDDIRKATLHWIAMHNKIVYGNFFLNFALIYNWGLTYFRQTDEGFYSRNGVSAGLGAIEIGYKFSGLTITLLGEGATGDPNNKNYGGSFQDIKASRGFSYIVVDNLGGLSIRGSGESSWYGMYSGALKTQFNIFNTIETTLTYFHFETTKEIRRKDKNSKTTWYGDEINCHMSYKYNEKVNVYFQGAVFMPNDAYLALDEIQTKTDETTGQPVQTNYTKKSAIYEIMVGGQIDF